MEKRDQEEKQAIARASQWRLLFLPFLILLVFLVLNRLWWCCIIPPWLFLLMIVILVLIPLPVSLIPRDVSPRRRPWWLLILLLLLALLWFFFPRVTIPAISLIVFSIWGIRWFILPLPVPVPPLTVPKPDPGTQDRPDEKNEHYKRPWPDDLLRIEGIGPKVAEVLIDSGITRFEELAKSDIGKLQSILNESKLYYKNPKTWPLQVRLAEIASASGKEEDWAVFYAYPAYLKDGLPPEE